MDTTVLIVELGGTDPVPMCLPSIVRRMWVRSWDVWVAWVGWLGSVCSVACMNRGGCVGSVGGSSSEGCWGVITIMGCAGSSDCPWRVGFAHDVGTVGGVACACGTALFLLTKDVISIETEFLINVHSVVVIAGVCSAFIGWVSTVQG